MKYWMELHTPRSTNSPHPASFGQNATRKRVHRRGAEPMPHTGNSTLKNTIWILLNTFREYSERHFPEHAPQSHQACDLQKTDTANFQPISDETNYFHCEENLKSLYAYDTNSVIGFGFPIHIWHNKRRFLSTDHGILHRSGERSGLLFLD